MAQLLCDQHNLRSNASFVSGPVFAEENLIGCYLNLIGWGSRREGSSADTEGGRTVGGPGQAGKARHRETWTGPASREGEVRQGRLAHGQPRARRGCCPRRAGREPGRLGRGEVGQAGGRLGRQPSSSRQGGPADRALGWLLRGWMEHASDEGGFRVGEPVQPEPRPQGSGGTGLGGAPRSLSA